MLLPALCRRVKQVVELRLPGFSLRRLFVGGYERRTCCCHHFGVRQFGHSAGEYEWRKRRKGRQWRQGRQSVGSAEDEPLTRWEAQRTQGRELLIRLNAFGNHGGLVHLEPEPEKRTAEGLPSRIPVDTPRQCDVQFDDVGLQI